MVFHVPDKLRIRSGAMKSGKRDGNNGAFRIVDEEKARVLFVIASDGRGWEHVSVSGRIAIAQGKIHPYTPLWDEMCMVKGLFWDEEDTVLQFHPAKSQYVNYHPHTLHLWRSPNQEVVLPPPILIGV